MNKNRKRRKHTDNTEWMLSDCNKSSRQKFIFWYEQGLDKVKVKTSCNSKVKVPLRHISFRFVTIAWSTGAVGIPVTFVHRSPLRHSEIEVTVGHICTPVLCLVVVQLKKVVHTLCICFAQKCSRIILDARYKVFVKCCSKTARSAGPQS